MKLNKKQIQVIVASCIVTVIFLAIYFPILFTSQETIFRVRDELNGPSNTTPYTIPVGYNNDVIGTEPGVQYSIRVRYRGEELSMYIWIAYPEYEFYIFKKIDSYDYYGEFDKIVMTTYHKPHIVYLLKIIKINYKIDWIYGPLIAIYTTILIMMVFLFRKYRTEKYL